MVDFLLNAPISPSGLFGNAVSTVVDKFQKAKIQTAVFQRFLPRHAQTGAQGKLLSLRAIYIPGYLNQGADIL